LLGLPAGELSNRHISLEDIWGSRAVRLREQLLEVSEPPAMFALLEREFLHRIRQSLIVHPAISFALRQFDSQALTARVASVQQATGYSDLRFITLFTDAVGLSPKRYSRIQRLRRVVEQIARGKRDLAEVAADNGYYDQSHLNRDFREFAGVTPGSYRPMPDRSALHAEVEGEDEGRKDGGT
jgi:AraC-like DNA-binding protein